MEKKQPYPPSRMKIYISFGQGHVHRVNGSTFDCDCLAEIECDSHSDGRRKAYSAFRNKFCTSYLEQDLPNILKFYPRGVIKLCGYKT